MLKSYAEIIMIYLTVLILSCNAFWWRATTEATPVVKQIPVGYFRTYTYHQPMTFPGAYWNTPFTGAQANRFSGWSQFPQTSSNAIASLISNHKYETQAPILTAAPTSAPTTQPTTQAPTQPPPSPPQQQYQGPPAAPSSSSSIISTSVGHTYIQTQPPASQYVSSGPIRSSHQSPDFPKYQYYYSNTPPQQKTMQQVRFVPCMCPVTVSMNSEYPESRSASLEDNDMDLPETDSNHDGLKSRESGNDVVVN